MKYRENRRTGDKISEIGMGTAYIADADLASARRGSFVFSFKCISYEENSLNLG